MRRTLLAPVLAALASLPALADDGITVRVEAVAGSDAPWNITEAVIDAPPADVWNIVSRCGDYKKTMVKIAAAKELERKGDENSSFTTVCQVTADLPFPLSDLTSVSKATHTVTPGEKYVRSWTLVSGDYDINEGSWTLVALDGGAKTKATYRLRARPKIPLPGGMLAGFTKDTLPAVMKNLQAQTKKK